MPAPLAPIAIKAAQFGAVAAVAWWAARRQREAGPRDVWRERVMDDLDEGLETDFERGAEGARAGASARWTRTIWVAGRGVEIDAAGLTRLRVRRVD
ncbi:MAG: hypothetical protein AAFU55_07950 [Pseudomonadota bacterium]